MKLFDEDKELFWLVGLGILIGTIAGWIGFLSLAVVILVVAWTNRNKDSYLDF
jgi:hypothetical protein